MLSLKPVAVAAAAAGLMAALPAGALAAPAHHAQAHAAGGDVTTLIYPSIVNTRLVRAQANIDRAAKYADMGITDKAASAMTAARNNLSKAWSGAKYVIQTAPPPAAAAAYFHKHAFRKSGRLRFYKGPRGRRVHQAGTAPAAGTSPYASQYDTAFAVLSLQHYAASTSVGLVPDTSGPTLTTVRSTLARSVNDRDAAIAYIHSIDTPPPAPADGKAQAHSAGTAPAAGGWATVMPNAIPLLDDEVQQAQGEMQSPGLSAAQMSILKGAEYRDIKTDNTLNQYWPPAPPEA